MYKFIILICLPFFLFAQSGKLLYIVDGDTVVLSGKNGNVICHMGEIDTPELLLNKKLKKEIKECLFSKKEFIKIGFLSYTYAKSILEVGKTYDYEILGITRSKNPICKLSVPKGLHIEIRPTYDEIMVSKGYALPYIVHSNKKRTKLFLKIAKNAKEQKLGLWKEHYDLMQCLIEHRYSLHELR